MPEWLATSRHRPSRGMLLDPVGLDAEVPLVEEVEERHDLLLVDRVVAELVDLLGAVAQPHAAPLAQVEVGRQQLARRVETGARRGVAGTARGGAAGSTSGRGGRPSSSSVLRLALAARASAIILSSRSSSSRMRRRATSRARRRVRCGRRVERGARDRRGAPRAGALEAPALARLSSPRAECAGARGLLRARLRPPARGLAGFGGARLGAALLAALMPDVSVSSFTSRRRCALTKSRSASRDVYAGREPSCSRARLPSATQMKRRYLRKVGGASAICATQPSRVERLGEGVGDGHGDAARELDHRRQRQDPVAHDVEGARHVAQDGEVQRGDRVHLVEELHQRVEAHHRGHELAREVAREVVVHRGTEDRRRAQDRHDACRRPLREPAACSSASILSTK